MNPLIGEPVIQAIGYAVKHNQMIAVKTTPDGSITIKPLGIFARMWHWNDPKFHEERLSKLASVVAQVISAQQRLSIAVAAEDPTLKVARNLLKELRLQKISSPAINDLKKEVVAAKLGITTITMDSNPGLQKFAEYYHLERYLLGYNNTLHIDPTTQQASIIKDGKLQPWQQVFEETKNWTKPAHTPQQAWVYGPEGIQNKDMYDWTELKPFMKGNPADWNHQFVFEFCICLNPNSIKNGNHSWLRLKTPTGDIYSVGLYEPGKANISNNVKLPLRVKPAFLMQPDVSEFWDFPITTIGFVINEESFLKIKKTIEDDKKDENVIFQLFNNNCVLYSKKLARIGGVDLPSADTVLQFFVPPTLYSRVSHLINKLPVFIQKVCLFVSTIFLNITQIALGGCNIDKNLNEQQRKRAVPHLSSFKDIFDVNKIYLNHPNTLAFRTHHDIQTWRQKEIEALAQTENNADIRKEKEKQVALSLPPSYYARPLLGLA